jgi:type II secretory pathway pseudopilin PulG
MMLVLLAALNHVGMAASDKSEVVMQKRTMADIRAIAVGLEAYMKDHGAYPIVERTTVGALRDTLGDYCPKQFHALDGWDRPIYVISSGVSYALWSNGRDGESDKQPTRGPQQSADADIVYTQHADDYGYFWQGPPGQDDVADRPCEQHPVQSVNVELQMLRKLGVRSGK